MNSRRRAGRSRSMTTSMARSSARDNEKVDLRQSACSKILMAGLPRGAAGSVSPGAMARQHASPATLLIHFVTQGRNHVINVSAFELAAFVLYRSLLEESSKKCCDEKKFISVFWVAFRGVGARPTRQRLQPTRDCRPGGHACRRLPKDDLDQIARPVDAPVRPAARHFLARANTVELAVTYCRGGDCEFVPPLRRGGVGG